jgi:hypothetical protein
MDQFRRLKPDEMIPGLPSQPWNRMLDTLQGQGLGERGAAGWQPDAIEFNVKNMTAGALPAYSVLRANAALNSPGDYDYFKTQDALSGDAPTADDPFVITQEPIGEDGIGRARILGLTRVQVDIQTEGDKYAVPVAGETGHLESQAGSGPARIIDVEAGTGVKWAAVLLLGDAAEAGADEFGSVTRSGFEVGPKTFQWVGFPDLLPAGTYTFHVSIELWVISNVGWVELAAKLMASSAGSVTFYGDDPIGVFANYQMEPGQRYFGHRNWTFWLVATDEFLISYENLSGVPAQTSVGWEATLAYHKMA